MAQVVVNSQVMRSKADLLKQSGTDIGKLYDEMLKEVSQMSSKMKGTTIETSQKQFASMQNAFEAFSTDMTEYSQFLTNAAEAFEATEADGTAKAQEQGKIF